MSADVHALVLAAGSSSRLGRNKQLVLLDGEPLVRRAVRQALEAGCAQVHVVTGFDPAKIAAALAGLPVDLVHNDAWEGGMGGSLACAARQLLALPAPPYAVLVVLPDQFAVDAAHLAALIERARSSPRGIVATEYAGLRGAPALFKAAYLPALAALPPAAGARKLIDRHADDCEALPYERAGLDLDTAADLDRLSASCQNGADSHSS